MYCRIRKRTMRLVFGRGMRTLMYYNTKLSVLDTLVNNNSDSVLHVACKSTFSGDYIMVSMMKTPASVSQMWLDGKDI
jgi:hypothetical protein